MRGLFRGRGLAFERHAACGVVGRRRETRSSSSAKTVTQRALASSLAVRRCLTMRWGRRCAVAIAKATLAVALASVRHSAVCRTFDHAAISPQRAGTVAIAVSGMLTVFVGAGHAAMRVLRSFAGPHHPASSGRSTAGIRREHAVSPWNARVGSSGADSFVRAELRPATVGIGFDPALPVAQGAVPRVLTELRSETVFRGPRHALAVFRTAHAVVQAALALPTVGIAFEHAAIPT